MEYIDEEDIDAMLINIDFEKAFDNLEWDFVGYCLKHLILEIILYNGLRLSIQT